MPLRRKSAASLLKTPSGSDGGGHVSHSLLLLLLPRLTMILGQLIDKLGELRGPVLAVDGVKGSRRGLRRAECVAGVVVVVVCGLQPDRVGVGGEPTSRVLMDLGGIEVHFRQGSRRAHENIKAVSSILVTTVLRCRPEGLDKKNLKLADELCGGQKLLLFFFWRYCERLTAGVWLPLKKRS